MVYLLLGTGFEETEAVAPLDLLRRAGVEVQTVGISGKVVYGSHKIGLEADILLEDVQPEQAEMVILPGGLGGVASLKACPEALNLVRQVWQAGKFVAAICAGPTILASLGILEGVSATCYPGCEPQMAGARLLPDAAAVTHGRIITGTSAGSAVAFGLSLIRALRGEEAAQAIARQIVIRQEEIYG